ncbi:MAG: FAD-dependent thymidylate synthase [Nitrospinaceae bacterium]|nr:FAD-dependent thymidylate synthase [Nitrospinaceae bacterium]
MKPKRTDDLTEQEKENLSFYVSDVDADVFVISNLTPEVVGAALARYSRAPTGIKETVVREFLNPDGTPNEVKGTELIDRVVNKFGDDSVAELAVAPLCIENISNLMTKIIEDCRIGGSPIEESTRYVLYDVKRNGQWRYVRPESIMKSGLAERYVQTMDFIFETYAGLVEPMQEFFRKKLPAEKFQIEVERDGQVIKAGADELVNDSEQRAHRLAYSFTMRSAACDVIRCILPASTKANMGLVGNGRFYSSLITKLLSQELDEGWLLAENIRKALETQIPTFIKRAGKNDYLAGNQKKLRELSTALFKDVPIETVPEVALIEDRVEDYAINLLANIVFPHVQHSTTQIRKIVSALSEEKRSEILSTAMGERESKRDRPPRALEYGYPINFDVITGFAEYRDLQRHRMLTQQRQDMNVSLGYSVPEEIGEIGKGEVVQECFERAESLHGELIQAGFIREAQYATLFNHFIRWNMGMNARELGHLVELRSQKAGHPKYRRTAQMMTKLYLQRHPEMEALVKFVDYNDYDEGISRAEQEARTARKSLASGVFDDMDC